jgi:thiamine transporter ThiT
MADQAHDYHRGEMDIHEQVSTFHLFNLLTKWGSLALAVLLVTTVLWFCTGAGFLGGLVTGLVVLVVGILVLRERKAGHH